VNYKVREGTLGYKNRSSEVKFSPFGGDVTVVTEGVAVDVNIETCMKNPPRPSGTHPRRRGIEYINEIFK